MWDPASGTDFFMKSAFVRNCLHTVMTLSLHSRSYTHAGELRWCKHEEGLKILIPHMDMDHLLCCCADARDHKLRGWRHWPSLAVSVGHESMARAFGR